jgi:hypothetical protein
MTRVIIRFKDGEHMNIPADCIDIRDGWIFAWKGDFIVAIVKADEVISCHLSEKKEGNCEK